jgi:acyl-CoA reductase-like NAD-dependent aldehyde dehydrogenase
MDRLLAVYSPLDGELIERVPVAGPADCANAVDTAARSLSGWRCTAPAERGRLLLAAAEAVRGGAQQLADLNHRETGRPREEAVQGAMAGVDALRQYAEIGPLHRGRSLLGDWAAMDFMVPEPRGLVVVLTPWNDPVAVACGLIGAALVTGNTVVHKPSEHCPGVGRLLTELIAAELPAGVLTAVLGSAHTGTWLTSHPAVDLIAHVGGSATGQQIGMVAAERRTKVLLENGGNDALVVDGDVDPGWAAEQAALGAFANAGQICTSVERIFVVREIAEEFLAALVDRAGDVELGPLIDNALRQRVHEHVTEACTQGATLLAGGRIPDGPGCHYPATVLTGCRPGMRVMTEETFGPVAPVSVVEDFAHGLREAALDRHGLAATVLTGSMANAQQAWRELPVGTVKINAVFGGAPGGAAQPRADSGDGFGYGPELLDEMTRTKVVHLESAPRSGRREP